jgi:HPt (histidine-containing phosphotransfer) domain-containing protein
MANESASPLVDPTLIAEIRRIEQMTGRNDVLAGFVVKLEGLLKGFGGTFSDHVARGDGAGAVRAAHTLKGTCLQLGAQALGELFAEVERIAKTGDYAGAKRKFEDNQSLVARSLEALRQA